MPQFCSLFYAILQSWRPKWGGHGPMAPAAISTTLLSLHIMPTNLACYKDLACMPILQTKNNP